MLGDDNETVDIEGHYIRQTEKAFLVEIDGEEYWLPKSRAEKIGRDLWRVEKWLANEKGIA